MNSGLLDIINVQYTADLCHQFDNLLQKSHYCQILLKKIHTQQGNCRLQTLSLVYDWLLLYMTTKSNMLEVNDNLMHHSARINIHIATHHILWPLK